MKRVQDLEQELIQIWNFTGGSTGEHGGLGWSIDQKRIYNRLENLNAEGGSLVFLTDGDTGYRRLDRLWHIKITAVTSLAVYNSTHLGELTSTQLHQPQL